MSATGGYYSPAGPGWRLAYSLVTLAHELGTVYGDTLTCLGTVGDASHANEDMSSDHNPFIRDPHEPSIGIVRAIDFGGPNAVLQQIRAHVWNMYAETDQRLYEYGYSKGTDDNLINNWGLPFGTHVDMGDANHLHISVTQLDGYHPSPNGYVAAIDSTAPWEFLPEPPIDEDNDMSNSPLFIAGVTGAPPDGPLQNAYYLVNDNNLTMLHLNGSQFAYHQALADVQIREGVGADCFAGYTVKPLSNAAPAASTPIV